MNRCLHTLVLLALATGAVSLNLLLVPAARAQAPAVTTLPASVVTATNATLNGTVNPNGLVTTAYYQYGLDTNYGDIGAFTALPATNATLTMPSFVAAAFTGGVGSPWTQSSAPSTNWYSVASSADGTHLAAAGAYAGIYTSTNSGMTWTKSSAPTDDYWYSVASSADGTRLAAVVYGGGIYASTNSGVTWTQSGAPSNPSTGWSSIASSADGTHLAAVVSAGGIYTSTNSGLTWTQSSAPPAGWQSIASSADGTRLAAVVDDGGGIYTSTNSGLTWTQTSAPIADWSSIASSADGTRLAAVAYRGGVGIYTSTGIQSSVAPGTIYHYRMVGLNNAGTTYGTDMTFTTPMGAPTATSLPASGVTATNATLNAVINTGGLDTAAYFAFGPDTNYGRLTPTNILAGTNSTQAVSALTTVLVPGASYHFQIIGFNGAGATLGGDMTFMTPPLAPVVTTLPAISITASNATLSGTVNPGYGVTTAYFKYGMDTNYGSSGDFTVLPATNATLTLPSLVVSAVTGAAGSQWTQSSAPSTNFWQAIASSADGTRLAAVVNGGGVYTSANGGVTWTQSGTPSAAWNSIASSADGTRLAAAIYGGGIYTSTNSGLMWAGAAAPPYAWSIASSADGTRLARIFHS